MKIETKVVHGGQHPDPVTGSLIPPLYQTSTFAFKDADHGARLFKGEEKGYIYTRLGNPTVDLLAEKMALLEGGDYAEIFASGCGALFCTILSIAESGSNIISDKIIYGGSYGQFKQELPIVGIDTKFVDTTNPKELEAAIDKKTKLIFIETPANPTLKIVDIKKCAEIAHKHKIPLVVDNTFSSPYLQRPIELGADAVVHSATKYLGGHGDLIAGVSVVKKEFAESLRKRSRNIGANISPFNAWLILRGLKTLAVRMDRHCENALKIAEFLESYPMIEKVYYPFLKSHTGYEIARQQMSNGGGVIGFEVKGGREAGKTLMNSVKLCILAVSLGDPDTLIQHPASMTHSAYSEEECIKVGLTPGFVRLSVGIENVEDIIDDLKQAMNKIKK
ncbi:MAG: aminotransferase class I/II-fold pyridoxal phosphate-dependent enzyme [bacterium]